MIILETRIRSIGLYTLALITKKVDLISDPPSFLVLNQGETTQKPLTTTQNLYTFECFPESRKKFEENSTKIWNKWRKVVNLHPKRWRKVVNTSKIKMRKVAKPPLQISKKVVSMLRRKVLPQIEEWYQGGCKKALLLTGARQVGKTTAVREFAFFWYIE